VVGLMSRLIGAPVKTFTIGFEGDAAYDETAYARLAAKRFGTDHTEFQVSPSAVDLIDRLVWHHDGPFGDSSAVPTFIVSQLARQHVTVALTGDGGDEVFAGYRRFIAAVQSERVPRAAAVAAGAFAAALPSPAHERSRLSEAKRFFSALRLPFDERITMWNAVFFADLPDLLRPELLRAVRPIDHLHYLARERAQLDGRSTLSRLLHANFASYLPDDLLVKTDRCSMASALEARSPFLDRELVEYVAALPDAFKLDGRRTKAVLRDAFADLVPADIERRGKMGFGVPLSAWFRGNLRDYMQALLLAPDARYRETLSGAFVERLVRRHVSGQANVGPQLWSLICYERWLQLLPGWRRGARPPSAPPSGAPALAGTTR